MGLTTIFLFVHGWRYTVECAYCSRQFKRMRRNTILKPHKDGYGKDCYAG